MFKSWLISTFCVVCAFAQTEAQNSGPVTKGPPVIIQFGDFSELGTVGFSALLGANSRVVGAPYSAEAVTERVQTLADGNRIVETTSSTIARDSEGRVRMERSGPKIGDTNAARMLITIEDPVAGCNYTLDAQTKTAFKMLAPKNLSLALTQERMAASQIRVTTKGGGGVSDDGPSLTVSSASTGGPVTGEAGFVRAGFPTDASVAKTDLGSQTMEGVLAQGTRVSRTIPAGSIGNEQPIVITTETWYSPDLKTLVMSDSSDPRIGETTYKLTNIQRAEPSPMLFQVPSDYTIKDQSAFFFHKADAANAK